MNFQGATPIKIPRYGSKCQWDDSVLLPLGLAEIVRNGRYTAQGAETRFGHSTRLRISADNAINTVALLRYLAAQPGTLNLQAVETILLLMYAADGTFRAAAPFLQGSLITLSDNTFIANTQIPSLVGLNPIIMQAYNRAFMALGDLLLPKVYPLVYDPSAPGLFPASDLPVGAPWTPNTQYRVGQIVSPSTFETFGQTNGQGTWVETRTGYLYQCIQAGTSQGAPPAWPQSFEGQVADGPIIWAECTPMYLSGLPDPAAPVFLSTVPNNSSPIVPGATVFLACTMVNSIGEGTNSIVNEQGKVDTSKVLAWKNNTATPVNLSVNLPAITDFLGIHGPLGGTFGAASLNLYIFIESSTDAATIAEQSADPSFYAQYIGGNGAGSTVVISTYPTGKPLPTTSTAATSTTVGNVPTGIRYIATIFEMQTGYQTGISNSNPVAVNVTQSGWPITALRVPTGPYNCRARVCASTVAGASMAGPYTYISQSDVESPGFNQADIAVTSTRIENNVSTVAEFNFTDTYLPGATNVTNYFDRKQLPPFVDVYFCKSLQRVVWSGAVGYRSAHIFSEITDGEAIRIPGSVVQVAPADGDAAICVREVRGIPYSFKENGIYPLETNGGDPKTWGARRLEGSVGLPGPKAIDIASQDGEQATEFAAIAHRSGFYMLTTGSPNLINRELVQDWETINWEYGHLVTVRIDPVQRLIYIMAPTNGSTTLNARWVLNYFFGMGDPVVFVQRRGILVPNVEGRKWSLDDLNFIDALYLPAKSRSAVQQAGLDIAKEMVFASADGSLKTITPNQYWDEDYNGNHVGYVSEWRGVLGDAPQNPYSRCIGGKFWGTGNGLANLTAYDDTGAPNRITGPGKTFILTPGQRTRADLPTDDQTRLSQKWAFGIDNGGVAGAWWRLFYSDLYVVKCWDSLPG